RDELTDTKTKLSQAQAAELELRKAKRDLETRTGELELTVARRVDEETGKIREQARKDAAEERALKEAEKDKLIHDLREQIEDLRRMSEQGSQQTQGEVLELDLEERVRRAFPFDEIAPVPKGMHGGDLVHVVRDGPTSDCGIILWESKRTKNWSDS